LFAGSDSAFHTRFETTSERSENIFSTAGTYVCEFIWRPFSEVYGTNYPLGGACFIGSVPFVLRLEPPRILHLLIPEKGGSMSGTFLPETKLCRSIDRIR
jgi:hypothetical protein